MLGVLPELKQLTLSPDHALGLGVGGMEGREKQRSHAGKR
jgi:hypothetical protein